MSHYEFIPGCDDHHQMLSAKNYLGVLILLPAEPKKWIFYKTFIVTHREDVLLYHKSSVWDRNQADLMSVG